MTFFGLTLSVALVDILMLNVLLAYSAYAVFSIGRLNVAFIAFSGLGGYISAIMWSRFHLPPLWCICLAIGTSALLALPLAVLLMRVTSVYLAIATIAVAAIFQDLLVNFQSLTHGADGIAGLPIVAGLDVLAPCVAVVILGFWLVSRSRWGIGMILQRSDERLALSVGINVNLNIAVLFMISASVAALQGALTAFWYGFVSPDAYSFSTVILVIAMVLLGGSSQWLGPLAGACFLTLIPQWLEPFGVWSDVATGSILLIVVLLLPEGLVGRIATRRGLHRARMSEESKWRLGDRTVRVGPSPVAMGSSEQAIWATVARTAAGTVLDRQPTYLRDFDVIAEQPAHPAGSHELLQCDNLTVQVGGLQILNAVALSVRAGEICGVVGPNGAGKSTLLNVISGFTAPGSGSTRFDGSDISHVPAWGRARLGIGRSFQQVRLVDSSSVRLNVQAGALRSSKTSPSDPCETSSIVNILRALNIEEFEDWPIRYLSYGTRRKVELARVAAGRPKLFLVDEPTAGVSHAHILGIERLLRDEARRGCAVVIVDHDLGFIQRIASRVVVMDAGIEIYQGPPSDAFADRRVISAYVGS